jgi:hypothetical protein
VRILEARTEGPAVTSEAGEQFVQECLGLGTLAARVPLPAPDEVLKGTLDFLTTAHRSEQPGAAGVEVRTLEQVLADRLKLFLGGAEDPGKVLTTDRHGRHSLGLFGTPCRLLDVEQSLGDLTERGLPGFLLGTTLVLGGSVGLRHDWLPSYRLVSL